MSNEDLFLCLSLSMASGNYLIIEISEDYYNHIKEYISHFALVLAINDEEKAQLLIDEAPHKE